MVFIHIDKGADMKTISVCMIVKNEEGVLARCLESVLSFCDELIIVDTGSTDKTISIAKTYTSHVYFFPWCDDFAKARNFSFSKATKEYCMWLDADDIVPVFSQQQLLKWKVATTYPDVVMLPYHIFTPTQEQAICSFYRERLLKRNNHDQWIGEIHEIIIPHGIIEYEEYPIEHHKTKTTDPDRNFHILDNLQKKGKTFSPRQLFYWANELFSHKKYKEAIQAYQKFLKTDGFFENKIQACYNLSKLYQLKNQLEKALAILYHSFVYDLPRSEIACEIARILYQQQQYNHAIYWYQKAIYPPSKSIGRLYHVGYHDLIPYIEMALCYYQVQQYELAIYYNQKALDIDPTNKTALMNHKFYLEKYDTTHTKD